MNRDEDLMLESFLERLPADPELWRLVESARTSDEGRELREWVELAGLLGVPCCEDAPGDCRDRLLRAVQDQRAGAAAPEVASADVVPFGAPRAPVSDLREPSSRRIVWTLAAVLSACCLFLAFFAGRWMEQRERIAVLEAREVGSPVDVPSTAPAVDENRRLRERLRMVTSVARYAYPLEPASTKPGSAADHADGVVYVCGAHQQWYLALNGLEPAPPGQEYRLWFLTDEGPRTGGRLEVVPGEPVELEASTLPQGTRGFSVTLEPSDAAADEPHGTMVLLSEDSVSL